MVQRIQSKEEKENEDDGGRNGNHVTFLLGGGGRVEFVYKSKISGGPCLDVVCWKSGGDVILIEV